jgi:phosphatidylserine synthase
LWNDFLFLTDNTGILPSVNRYILMAILANLPVLTVTGINGYRFTGIAIPIANGTVCTMSLIVLVSIAFLLFNLLLLPFLLLIYYHIMQGK